jgi:hypothetical protein
MEMYWTILVRDGDGAGGGGFHETIQGVSFGYCHGVNRLGWRRGVECKVEVKMMMLSRKCRRA